MEKHKEKETLGMAQMVVTDVESQLLFHLSHSHAAISVSKSERGRSNLIPSQTFPSGLQAL